MSRTLVRLAVLLVAAVLSSATATAQAASPHHGKNLTSAMVAVPDAPVCVTTSVGDPAPATVVTATRCSVSSTAPSTCVRARGVLTCSIITTVIETIDSHAVAGSGCSICTAAESFSGSRTTVTAVTSRQRGNAAPTVTTSYDVTGSCAGYVVDFYNEALTPVIEPLDYCFSS